MSLFSTVAMAPRDPILGLTEQFNADTRTHKVNLGVGVYFDAEGKLPVLACVREAERQMAQAPKPKGYLPIDGIAAYDTAVKDLVFGAQSAPVTEGRVATVQALGGTGGLKLAADLLAQIQPGTRALISDPTWDNHRGLFSRAGFEVHTYPYYDAQRRGIRFDAMLEYFSQAPAGSVVILHACCHNPTGYDLSPAQWAQVVEVVRDRQLVPILDMAYQGFGHGIEEDGAAVRLFMATGMTFMVATSFSKSFSLYGERVGALSVVCQSADEAARVLSQLKIVVRTNYSTPPSHGAQVVTAVLTSATLRQQWEQELSQMRERIGQMREAFLAGLRTAGVQQDMSHITTQMGMFSYTGLQPAQMQRLRDEFAVYGLDSGRICVAALNGKNMEAVVRAVVSVL